MPDPVLRVQSALTARDHQLLDWLFDHGVLTTPQVAEALLPSLDFAQHRLTRLTTLQVVDRFRPLRADGGSFPYHYVVDQLGAEVVAAQRDEPPPRPGFAKTNRRRWTSGRMLAHRLGVNGFFTALAGYARIHSDHRLQRWWPESWCAELGAFAQPGDVWTDQRVSEWRRTGHIPSPVMVWTAEQTGAFLDRPPLPHVPPHRPARPAPGRSLRPAPRRSRP